MVSSATTEEIFSKIREDASNLICADCGSEPVLFASISHGTLICSSCSSIHKSLGPNISFVKSINDSWSIRQLKIMTAGGNSTLKNFFDSYNMPSTATIEFKYHTLAAKYYREMLKVMAEGEPCNMVTPSLEEGLSLIPDQQFVVKSEDSGPKEEKKQPTGYMGSLFGSAYNAAVGIGKGVYEKVKDIETYRTIENKAFETAAKVGEGIKWSAQKGVEIGKGGLEWGAQKGYENLEWGKNTGYNIGTKGVNFLRTGAHTAYDTMTGAAANTYNTINLNERTKRLKEESMNILTALERNTIGKVYGVPEGRAEEEEKSQPERVPTPPEYR